MFKFHFFLLAFLFNGVFAQSQEGTTGQEFSQTEDFKVYEDPKKFVQSLVDEVLHLISVRGELSVEEQERALIELSREYFDVNRISRFVLARSRKKFTQDQFEEFMKYYEVILAKTLIALLNKGAHSNVNIDNIIVGDFKVITAERKGRVTHELSSFVKLSEKSEPVSVELSIIEKDDVYKIYNVSIASFNYVVSQRSTYDAMNLHSSNEINKLLSDMKRKSGL